MAAWWRFATCWYQDLDPEIARAVVDRELDTLLRSAGLVLLRALDTPTEPS
ncbi:MAG: hypothetical protein ACK4GB_08025 [Tepidimonas sp.]